MANKVVRILGIDPGSVKTGFGVIESDGTRSVHLAHGTIDVAGHDFPVRLGKIFQEIAALIEEWRPQECAVEDVFMSRNASSALKLGQARGAAIAAAVNAGLSVSEYPARLVKQSITGTGGAEKAQVQHMVGVLLNLRQSLQADAADGLAVALSHAHWRGQKLPQAAPR
ncbi:MAG: crossover junction endodeoxyribonuclease RuvC [Pseudomonadota bacterium]